MGVQRAILVWYNRADMRLIGSPSRAYAADDERGFLPLGAAPAPLRSRYSRREALGLAAGGIFLPDWLRRQPEPVPVYGYRVVEAYPHDRDAYTEGLDYVDGDLYESTGLEGQSTLRRVDLETGEVPSSRPRLIRPTSAKGSWSSTTASTC